MGGEDGVCSSVVLPASLYNDVRYAALEQASKERVLPMSTPWANDGGKPTGKNGPTPAPAPTKPPRSASRPSTAATSAASTKNAYPAKSRAGSSQATLLHPSNGATIHPPIPPPPLPQGEQPAPRKPRNSRMKNSSRAGARPTRDVPRG